MNARIVFDDEAHSSENEKLDIEMQSASAVQAQSSQRVKPPLPSKEPKEIPVAANNSGPAALGLFGNVEEKSDKITLSERLVKACLDKDEKSALRLIQERADVNWKSRKHRVMIAPPPFLTQWISYSGLHYNVPHDQVATPLLAAVVNGLDQVVRQLTEAGANPNERYHFVSNNIVTADETLLHLAVRTPNNVKIIRALLEGGANVDGLADYNDGGALIAKSISSEHSVYLLKELMCSCALGCIVFSLCCLVGRKKIARTPNVTPMQMAALFIFRENIEALASVAPPALQIAMQR